jgi:putative oxidoreductase
MLRALFRTTDDLSLLILRLTLGGVMLPHGAQKLLGWYGGFGFNGTIGSFTQQMGLPWIVAFLIIIGESFGSVGLIVGFLTRIAAFGILLIMIGAIVLVHWPHGFFMNWFGKQAGEGYEYHLLAAGISLVLLLYGGGRWSVDRELDKQLPGKSSQ